MNVIKAATIGKLATGVHRGRDCIAEIVTGAVDAGHALTFFEAAIMCTPRAENVEVLQRETDRIELCVAAGACFRFGVFGDQFANRFHATDVRFDGGDTGWRRRQWLADEAVHHPYPAEDGRGARAVRRKLQDGSVREQSTVRTALRQVDAPQGRSLNLRQAVMPRETIVHKREVRVNQRNAWEDFRESSLRKRLASRGPSTRRDNHPADTRDRDECWDRLGVARSG